MCARAADVTRGHTRSARMAECAGAHTHSRIGHLCPAGRGCGLEPADGPKGLMRTLNLQTVGDSESQHGAPMVWSCACGSPARCLELLERT
eukprot:15175363-Alexandrium_andersonii.AAC.1